MKNPSAPAASTHPLAPFHALWEGAAMRWRRLRAPRSDTEPRPFGELRRRLIITNVLATTFVLLIISVAIYMFEANLELAQIDRQLTREANAKVLEGLPGTTTLPDPNETPYDPLSANFFSIVVARGGIIVQDDDQVQRYGLPDWIAIGPVITGEKSSNITGAIRSSFDFRLYTVPIVSNGAIVGAVQSGMSLDGYHQQLQDLVRGLVFLDLFIALLMLGSSIYLTDRALKPARAAFERQRQFAAGASHELRTPLALIRSLAELVADHRCAPTSEGPAIARGQPSPAASASLESQESVTADAQEIVHEVDYMTRLVTDLLLLARDEHDRRALNWVIVDVRRVLQGVVQRIEPLASAQGITLSSDLAGSKVDGSIPALVEGDPDRLRELAFILLENAVRYTPRGGSVLVTLDVARGAVMRGERHGHITFAVRDTGVGIAPADLPHVFEPFYRATSSTLRRVSGTEVGGKSSAGSGLGLALAHWIVEAHHGEIKLSSQPGKGATFTVELPLVASARPTSPPSRATPRVTRPV